MNYHLRSKKRTNKKILSAFLVAVFFLGAGYLLNYFAPNFLYRTVEPASTFFWRFDENKEKTGWFALITSKQKLIEENELLKNKLQENQSLIIEAQFLKEENELLKNIWGRKTEENTILSRVLLKPNNSPYDTLIIDVGFNENTTEGLRVFAPGGILIGFIESVGKNSSIVRLLSDQSIITDAVLTRNGITLSLSGKGAGNFEVLLPKTTEVEVGDIVVAPDLSSRPIARIESIDVTDTDSFQKLFLAIPINIFEIDWVEVEVK